MGHPATSARSDTDFLREASTGASVVGDLGNLQFSWSSVDMENSAKPDFAKGFAVELIPDGGMIQGQVDGEEVVLVRRGSEFFAVGAYCTHYHGSLAEWLVAGDELS